MWGDQSYSQPRASSPFIQSHPGSSEAERQQNARSSLLPRLSSPVIVSSPHRAADFCEQKEQLPAPCSRRPVALRTQGLPTPDPGTQGCALLGEQGHSNLFIFETMGSLGLLKTVRTQRERGAHGPSPVPRHRTAMLPLFSFHASLVLRLLRSPRRAPHLPRRSLSPSRKCRMDSQNHGVP